MRLFRSSSAGCDKGELIHRRRVLEESFASLRRGLVHALTVQAKTPRKAEQLRGLVRDLEAQMTALERELDEVRAGLMAGIVPMRRAEREAQWSAWSA